MGCSDAWTFLLRRTGMANACYMLGLSRSILQVQRSSTQHIERSNTLKNWDVVKNSLLILLTIFDPTFVPWRKQISKSPPHPNLEFLPLEPLKPLNWQVTLSTSLKFRPTALIRNCTALGAGTAVLAVSACGTHRSPVREPRAGMLRRKAPVYFTAERANLTRTRQLWMASAWFTQTTLSNAM